MKNNRSAVPFSPAFTSLSEQVAIHGKFRANDIALQYGDHQISWSAYDTSGNKIGQRLMSAGIEKGDRIAMVVNNHSWAHELLLGIWRAGAVAVPLSPMLDASSLARMLSDAGAKFVFSSSDYDELVIQATSAGITHIPEGDSFRSWLGESPDDAPKVELTAEDLAVIIYSSGTTGTPKGIAHNHASRHSFASGFAAEFRFQSRSVALSSIPMHSNGAWLSWSPAMWIGARTVILPTFTPEAFIKAVKKHSPTHGFIVPTMAKALLTHPEIEHAGLDCFEVAITAGSPMPEATYNKINQLTGNALYELWGLTEGVATVITPPEKLERPCSVGRPMLGCDIRLIDAHDNDVTFSGVGEIVGRSAGQMSGYWNRQDANTDLLWRSKEGKSYLRTGDLGEFDCNGYLTLRGRTKDMIISGGLNVYPVDIEALLIRHDAVSDATVIGVEDEKWGETPVAFVILTATYEHTNPDTLLAWANKQLATHQRLSKLLIHTGDFPRNTLGKVVKPQLKALL